MQCFARQTIVKSSFWETILPTGWSILSTYPERKFAGEPEGVWRWRLEQNSFTNNCFIFRYVCMWVYHSHHPQENKTTNTGNPMTNGVPAKPPIATKTHRSVKRQHGSKSTRKPTTHQQQLRITIPLVQPITGCPPWYLQPNTGITPGGWPHS